MPGVNKNESVEKKPISTPIFVVFFFKIIFAVNEKAFCCSMNDFVDVITLVSRYKKMWND